MLQMMRLSLSLQLAVSEAGSNIVLHGLEGQRERSIELILNIDDQQASVTFMYTGCTFTPNTVPSRFLRKC